jgi:hypothetical protein
MKMGKNAGFEAKAEETNAKRTHVKSPSSRTGTQYVIQKSCGGLQGSFEYAEGDHGLNGSLRRGHGPLIQKKQRRGFAVISRQFNDVAARNTRDAMDFKNLDLPLPHGLPLESFVHIDGLEMRRFAVVQPANGALKRANLQFLI